MSGRSQLTANESSARTAGSNPALSDFGKVAQLVTPNSRGHKNEMCAIIYSLWFSMWFVYILSLSDWKYYVWSTRDVDRRFLQHQQWDVLTTKNKEPKLLFAREYWDYGNACVMEKFLKKQKSRKVIEKFMSNEWQGSSAG